MKHGSSQISGLIVPKREAYCSLMESIKILGALCSVGDKMSHATYFYRASIHANLYCESGSSER
ncbi:protein of unknown function (plasmid) [Xenorhabdus nematophila AN6/1]|nr:protein of unknown function [Xenorhabdus nematophila AN6/1]